MKQPLTLATQPGVAADSRMDDVELHWGWTLTLGLVFIVLGTAALGASTFMTLSSVIIFGVFTLTGGMCQLIDVFKCTTIKQAAPRIGIGLLYVFIGILMMSKPALGSLMLTLVLGIALICVGVARLFMACQTSTSRHRIFLSVAGITSLLLGAMVLWELPFSAFWVLGLMVAIEMVMHGISYVALSVNRRSANS